MIGNKDINSISGIPNENYFITNYYDFINKKPHSKLIMIDLNNFKSLNDTFGHNVGDYYLIYFSKLLLSTFNDDLVARLHGDEFVIVTNKSDKEITDLFINCIEFIKQSASFGTLPRPFTFSAGSYDATYDLSDSSTKADYMMYYAKNNKKTYQSFDETIWNNKEALDSFLNKLSQRIKHDHFTHYEKEIFTKNQKVYPLTRIYTKDENGKPLFDNIRYDYLRETTHLSEFDIFNFNKLINANYSDDKKRVILIDYTTLINSIKFADFLSKNKYKNNKFIVGIDLQGISSNKFDKLIDNIRLLRNSGFEILFDKVDTKMPDIVWDETNPEFITFSTRFWQKAIDNKRTKHILENKIDLYNDSSVLLFGNIETKDEFEFLKSISLDNSLFYGNHFGKEKKLILK